MRAGKRPERLSGKSMAKMAKSEDNSLRMHTGM